MQKQNRITPEVITTLERMIFSFLEVTLQYAWRRCCTYSTQMGAIMGQGVGLQGRTYAIPTMFGTVDEIKPYVLTLSILQKIILSTGFSDKNRMWIAGFSVKEIAGLFKPVVTDEITNIFLPEDFVTFIQSQVNNNN